MTSEHADGPAPASAHPHGEADPRGDVAGLASDEQPVNAPVAVRPTRRGRGVLLAAVLLVLVGVAFAAFTWGPTVYRALVTPDFDGPPTGAVSVVVEPGQTGSQIAASLYEAGVVASGDAFVQALNNNPGDELQPGTYNLQQEMPAAMALTSMRQGPSVERVTIREGLWKSQVFEELSTATGHSVAEYEKAAANVEALGLPASANGNVEGYLFPATYDFDPNSTPTEQLKEMVNQTTTQLREAGVADADAERVITIASLVEGEARLPADRPKVARVIYNRLALPMRLQMDSSVNYGVQNKSITTTDAERADPNGYNTYAKDGLPVGPIGNPGVESIQATLNPAAGDWLYFVTVNPETGETVFTNNKADHDKAVLQFQQWCQERPGTC